MQIGKSDFGRAQPHEVLFGIAINVFGKFRQLRSPDEHGRPYHERWINLRIAMGVDVVVEHELNDGSL